MKDDKLMKEWSVAREESGMKLVAFLSSHLEGGYSARSLKRMIEKNFCQINKRVERFAGALVGEGDHVTLRLEQLPVRTTQQFQRDRILFEDESVLVYNKPAGINCDEAGVIKLLKAYTKSLFLVHRLDQETTGALILAKDRNCLECLIGQFRQHHIEKKYLALVDGVVREPKGIIENDLGKKGTYAGQTIWGEVSQGLFASTAWQRVNSGRDATLLSCFPKTGRTHQIRVHLAGIGHPILGDYQYGKQFRCLYRPPRILLHAEEIRFSHPVSGKEVDITAPVPDDFLLAQQQLGL